MNVNLQKAGKKPVDQKYVDELQSQFELYYADQHMTDNKALVKFVQWIMRNQDDAKHQVKPEQQNKWDGYFQNLGQPQEPSNELDVTPKKSLLIEEVGHA